MAIGMQSKGIREFSVLHSLIYRNRNSKGLELIDEEVLTWEECLHRYDKY